MDAVTQSRLRELKSECGCKAGSVALLVSVSTYVTYAAWMDPITRSYRERVITAIAIGLAAAMIGKVVGVLRARYQYHQLLSVQDRAAMPPGTAAFANLSK